MAKIHGYNEALADSRARMQRELRLGEWMNLNQKAINEQYKKVTSFIEERGDSPLNVYGGISSSPASCPQDVHTIHITLSVRNLEGLKDPLLEKALMPFLDATESKCTDYPQYLNRDYMFTYKLHGGNIHVLIGAYVKEDNPTCRRILIDRRTVTRTEDVYQLSCDGDIVEAGTVNPKLEAPVGDPNVIEA